MKKFVISSFLILLLSSSCIKESLYNDDIDIPIQFQNTTWVNPLNSLESIEIKEKKIIFNHLLPISDNGEDRSSYTIGDKNTSTVYRLKNLTINIFTITDEYEEYYGEQLEFNFKTSTKLIYTYYPDKIYTHSSSKQTILHLKN